MALQKNDFIQIEFTGKVKDTGEIFDSNIKEDIKKSGLKTQSKYFVFCLSQGMFLKGIEDFLIGKNIGNYEIELEPQKAFGIRDPKFVRMIPIKIFNEQKLNPIPGTVFNFDGRIAKVLTVSGGRVMVDFNHPLAGKKVIYNVNVLKKIEDLNEKIKSLILFLFRKEFKFEVKDKELIIQVEKHYLQFVEMFKDKFKEILDLDLKVKEIQEVIKASIE
ncbi:MAG: peptidylprolyl isomerase [archaeon]